MVPKTPPPKNLLTELAVATVAFFDKQTVPIRTEDLIFGCHPKNEKLNAYSDRPVHDWSSHIMDAFRYLAIIQSKKRNKGMTEEEANRLQDMYQVRY